MTCCISPLSSLLVLLKNYTTSTDIVTLSVEYFRQYLCWIPTHLPYSSASAFQSLAVHRAIFWYSRCPRSRCRYIGGDTGEARPRWVSRNQVIRGQDRDSSKRWDVSCRESWRCDEGQRQIRACSMSCKRTEADSQRKNKCHHYVDSLTNLWQKRPSIKWQENCGSQWEYRLDSSHLIPTGPCHRWHNSTVDYDSGVPKIVLLYQLLTCSGSCWSWERLFACFVQ